MALTGFNVSAQPALFEPVMLPVRQGFAEACVAPPPGLLPACASPPPGLVHPALEACSRPPPGLTRYPDTPMKVELPLRAQVPAVVDSLVGSAVSAADSHHARWSALPPSRKAHYASPVAHHAGMTEELEADSDHLDEASTSWTASDVASNASTDAPFGACTTVAIMNIPYTYPAWKFQAELDAEGLPYDYFHFPKDSRKGRNRGFAFVNFTNPEAARAFHDAFHNRLLAYPGDQEKRITVAPSSLQGFESNAKLHPFSAARTTTQTGRAGGQGSRSHQGERQSKRTSFAGAGASTRCSW